MLKFFCPISKGPAITSSNKIINQVEQEVALGKQNIGAVCPKDKLKVFWSPESGHYCVCVCWLCSFFCIMSHDQP